MIKSIKTNVSIKCVQRVTLTFSHCYAGPVTAVTRCAFGAYGGRRRHGDRIRTIVATLPPKNRKWNAQHCTYTHAFAANVWCWAQCVCVISCETLTLFAYGVVGRWCVGGKCALACEFVQAVELRHTYLWWVPCCYGFTVQTYAEENCLTLAIWDHLCSDTNTC